MDKPKKLIRVRPKSFVMKVIDFFTICNKIFLDF